MSKKVKDLVKQLTMYNKAYRSGKALISDGSYDNLKAQLVELDPDHPFLLEVEPTPVKSGAEVRHKIPMLSLAKAFIGDDKLERYVERVNKAANEIGVTTKFRVTPKLDGVAGNDQEDVLATRGDGRKGTDITHIFAAGVKAIGGRNKGLGEIVMVLSYFQKTFAATEDHPRNMIAGMVSADNLNDQIKKALKDGKVHFVPYVELAKQAKWEGSGSDLLKQIEQITEQLTKKADYPLDGMVVEAINPKIHQKMGSTNHHNRWQIAVKTKGETAVVTIEKIVWQTGRTGKVTPVIRINPTKISGATIRNVTAHNAGTVKELQLGEGAVIEVIRSGEVIPKLERVVKPAKTADLATKCPSCSGKLTWKRDFLYCTNPACPAQKQTGLRHWFKQIDNCDGFGPKTIETLVAKGYNTIKSVYTLTEDILIDMGFGDKQSENLINSLENSQKASIEDARLLSGLGISNLGIGDSRKLLSEYKITQVKTLTKDKIVEIKGFAEKSAEGIATGLQENADVLEFILQRYTNIEHTKGQTVATDSAISGKVVMFTGSMSQDRDEMKAQAKQLGARVITSVSKKLEILIIGKSGASQSKIDKAKKYGAEVIDEATYVQRLNNKS